MPSRCRSLLLVVLAGCTGTHPQAASSPAEPGGVAGAAGAAAAPARPADVSMPGASGAVAPGSAGAPAAGQPADGNAGSGAAGDTAPAVDPPDDDPPASDGCRPTFTLVDSLDADTPLGYRAADILAFAAGTHQTSIRWQPAETRLFSASYGPESGEHGLTVRVEYAGGELRLMHREPDPNAFFEPGSGCGGGGEWLEIDVQLEVTSDGGALAEVRPATLLVHNELWVTITERGPDRASDCTLIAADELGGSFAVTAVEPADAALRELCLELYLSPAGVAGQMWGTLEHPSAEPGDEIATFELGFARIGAPGCDRVGGAAVAIDDDRFGITGQSVLDVIASVPTADATWQDGSSTELELSIEHGDGPACVEVFAIGGFLQLESRLRITSADGRIDATWPVDVLVEASDGAPPPEVVVALPEGLAVDELGIAGVDVSGYELVTANAGFAFVSTSSGVELSGGLEIYGLAQVDCPLPPPGAPPCPEQEFLDSIAWTSP